MAIRWRATFVSFMRLTGLRWQKSGGPAITTGCSIRQICGWPGATGSCFRAAVIDGVVAISERVRQQMKEYYGVPDEKIVTIPNGINLSRFSPDNAKARNEMRRSLGFDESTPLVLFVGSQFRLKGLEVAIRALARMKTQAHLLVVGNDTPNGFRQLAKELGIAERVHFLGPEKTCPKSIRPPTSSCFPSLYETFALVCLEAMASGLPVLASRVGGIEDYLRDEENGLFIKRDGQDIAQKLDRVLGDAELRARMRSNGLKTAANYSWDKIAQQYLRLFDQLMMEREAASNGGIIRESALSTLLRLERKSKTCWVAISK
jgi:UDP-glucose:(heptosyl)LPS alpha-1,3-glucosyltransferase